MKHESEKMNQNTQISRFHTKPVKMTRGSITKNKVGKCGFLNITTIALHEQYFGILRVLIHTYVFAFHSSMTI